MRGHTAKRLRRVARSLQLAPRTEYLSVGSRDDGITCTRVMRICFRRAYKDAKMIYMGRSPGTFAERDNDVLER